MRLLAVVPSVYDRNPSQRYRIEQWEPLLRASGVEITYRPFEDAELNAILYQRGRLAGKLRLVGGALVRRFGEVRGARDFDAVYVLREAALLGPPFFEWMLARSGTPYVFDFDDAVFERYVSPANGYLSYLKFPGKTRTICRLAAHVMAGNEYLADYARRVNPNVTVVPTTVDTSKYTVEERPPNDVPVIGWTGSYSTVQHLLTLAGALRRLAERERFRLRVIGAPNMSLDALGGLEVESLPWRSETEVEDLRPLDVGVMPLPEDRWSRGKCGMKALQYMGLAVPTVCSPVGVNSEIIRDGENGLLARDESEWVEKLGLLLRSPELRARLGRAGRATVEERYSARAQAPRVLRVFESVVAARPRAAAGGRG
ncbi:MAG: glycosyltransferase family 4 protein, partial [Acidobacteria bacterium]|nr:glycosyltransferase family 4 protein [Acidobacteriota bacterium]